MTESNKQRYEQLADFLSLTAKSGYVDVRAIITEMAELLDMPHAIKKDSSERNEDKN